MTIRWFFAAAVLPLSIAIAACGSSNDAGGTGGTGGAGGTAAGGAGGSAGAGTGGGAGAAGSGGGQSMVCPTSVHKTLVVVGDSISDVGGSGGPDDQKPFYRTLLAKNDDSLYPAWKGLDLATCWGLDPNANVVKASVGGAVVTEGGSSGASVLLEQVKGLPATLEGPVLVVGTIGGNDVMAGFIDFLANNTAKQQQDVADFVKGWDDAMDELTRPDRFGSGVKVDVLITNIYDPSGGTGDFTYTPESKSCPGALALWPKTQSTDPALKPWNDALVTEAGKYPEVHLLELHGAFLGHQVDTTAADNWFHDDCIHPNAMGHEHLRELFWGGIVALP